MQWKAERPQTQTATGQEGMGPATPLTSMGGLEPLAPTAPDTGRALASTLAATLPAGRMEVLLGEERRPSSAPGPAMMAPVGNPTSPRHLVTSNPLTHEGVVHFREIPENRFLPENLTKPSSTFVQTTRRKESIALGSLAMIPVREEDGEAAEYGTNGWPQSCNPLGIYFQACFTFAGMGSNGNWAMLYTSIPTSCMRSTVPTPWNP